MVTHLHVHTHYSLLEAFGKPSAFLDKAKEMGMEALAITDYNGMYWVIEFYKYAKKIGIKPILWVELGLVSDMTHHDKEHAGSIVLLARTQQWYENLLALTTMAHLRWYANKQARIDIDLLEQHASWVTLIHSGLQSRLSKQSSHSESALLDEQLNRMLKAVWKDHMYIGITAQPESNGKNKPLPQQQEFMTIAQRLWIEMIVTGNIHYPSSSDKDLFEILWAIRDNDRIYERPKTTIDQSLHEEKTLRICLQNQGRAAKTIDLMIENTNRIAHECDITITLDAAHFPTHQTSPHIQHLYEKYHDALIEGA
jgi:DNA polymerase-3 subunit alpha